MQLSERFLKQPRTEALNNYITRKYSSYGYPKAKHIEYNPESKDNHYRWVEHVSEGLRHVGSSSDIIRMRHTGYYVDNFQDETVHGEVYQLPARDGQPQYIPAVSDPWNNDCALVAFRDVTDDKEDAARWADSMAERYAEDAREDQAKQQAEDRIEEIAIEIKNEYKDFRRISREIRANCDKLQGVRIVSELVRKEWQRTKATIHELRAEREKIEQYGIEY